MSYGPSWEKLIAIGYGLPAKEVLADLFAEAGNLRGVARALSVRFGTPGPSVGTVHRLLRGHGLRSRQGAGTDGKGKLIGVS